VSELWQAGRDDVQRTIARGETVRTTDVGENFRVYDLAN